MKRIAFRLSMPGCASWNGQWTGADRNYVLVRNVRESRAADFVGRSWSYSFGDGWVASINAREMQPRERVKSDGFCGYDWMVDSILRCGRIEVAS